MCRPTPRPAKATRPTSSRVAATRRRTRSKAGNRTRTRSSTEARPARKAKAPAARPARRSTNAVALGVAQGRRLRRPFLFARLAPSSATEFGEVALGGLYLAAQDGKPALHRLDLHR